MLTDIEVNIFDGVSVDEPLNRGAIASKLIAEKPALIRFSSLLLSEEDHLKLEALATNLNYKLERQQTYIILTKS